MTDAEWFAWITRGQTVAAFLVAIGVSGEFLGDWIKRPIERRIEAAREMEIARLNLEISQINLEAEQQREKTAMAERALLELQERARPRTIDAEGRKAIIDWLEIGGPYNAPIDFEFVGGSTTEPGEFTRALADVIRAAGWKVGIIDGGPALGTPARGVIIRISDIGGVDEQARTLQNALAKGGIDARLAKNRERFKPGEISVMVGLKP
jgi:hypothetical protein